MAVVKVDTLSKSVAEGPSLMTGSIPRRDWQDMPVEFKPGNYAYPTKSEILAYLDSQPGLSLPNARDWSPEDDDWKLPEDCKGLFYRSKGALDCCIELECEEMDAAVTWFQKRLISLPDQGNAFLIRFKLCFAHFTIALSRYMQILAVVAQDCRLHEKHQVAFGLVSTSMSEQLSQ